MIKVAMIKIHEWMSSVRIDGKPLASRMIMQVHDELVFDVPKSELELMQALVKHEMESAFKLAVPLVVEIGVGDNWLDAH